MRDTSTGRIRGTTTTLDAAARQLRRDMTAAEAALWQELRGHRLAGLSFRRQHPIGPFVVDFACPSRLLAVEIDGSVHVEQTEQDDARTQILETYGWHVIRFSNDDIERELSRVLKRIEQAASIRQLAPGQRGFRS